MTVALIIPAAGIGNRFSREVKKQFFRIDDKPILYFTLKKILSLYNFDEVIIGINNQDAKEIDGIIRDLNLQIDFKIVQGGETRAHTVLNCLKTVTSDITLVHDAVRPFISKDIIDSVIRCMLEFDGAVPVLKVRDTVKRTGKNENIIKETIERDDLYLAHTPQGFKTELLKKALFEASRLGLAITDESSAMELQGRSVAVVPSSCDNIKITYMEDIETVYYLKNKYFK